MTAKKTAQEDILFTQYLVASSEGVGAYCLQSLFVYVGSRLAQKCFDGAELFLRGDGCELPSAALAVGGRAGEVVPPAADPVVLVAVLNPERVHGALCNSVDRTTRQLVF